MARELLQRLERGHSADANVATPAADSQATLSPRECEYVRHVADGHSDKQIAAQMSITFRTVRTYYERACDKLEMRGRSALAAWHAKRSRPRIVRSG